MKKKLWLTYSWVDNKDSEVDFIAQELKNEGIDVKQDRFTLSAGHWLWEQLDEKITDPTQSDAWLIYATVNSLGSKPCKEEFQYALGRALDKRGEQFPLIALFPSSIDDALIPSALTSRLHVSLTDPNWKERIKSSVEGREPAIEMAHISPFVVKPYDNQNGSCTIEIRPRAGSCSPFVVGIPITEAEELQPYLLHGYKDGAGAPSCSLFNLYEGQISNDGNWKLYGASNEATPTQSYYLVCRKKPSQVIYGFADGRPLHNTRLLFNNLTH